jgi:hypothetical protein
LWERQAIALRRMLRHGCEAAAQLRVKPRIPLVPSWSCMCAAVQVVSNRMQKTVVVAVNYVVWVPKYKVGAAPPAAHAAATGIMHAWMR